jgi:phosphoenolpyruvate---glycerone phosphotransferase subunit DhaM
MLEQVAQGSVPVAIAGGTADGRLGTNPMRVLDAIREVLGESGVLVLVDIGSAVLAVDMAIEMLTPAERARVTVSGGPFVEGAVMATVQASIGATLAYTAAAANAAGQIPKLPEAEGQAGASWNAAVLGPDRPSPLLGLSPAKTLRPRAARESKRSEIELARKRGS